MTIVARSTGTAGLSRRIGTGSSSAIRRMISTLSDAGDGRLQGQQLIKRRAQGIDVGAAVDHGPLPGRLLGAHVAQRAGQVAGERQAGVPLDVGHAEVGDPQIAALVQKQVGRLDVAVNDPLVVCVAERLGGLDAQAGDGAQIGRAPNGRWHLHCGLGGAGCDYRIRMDRHRISVPGERIGLG